MIPQSSLNIRSHRDYQFPHTITRWRKAGVPDLTGQQPWEREVLKCRFQAVNRLYVREDGENAQSMSYVYTNGDLLKIDDRVALGEYTETVPVAQAYPIMQRRVISNMRNTRREYRYIQ